MTKEQLRLRMLSEDPEEAQFLDEKRKAQYEEDLKHIEREEIMRYEKVEMLKAYLGERFRLIDEDANDFNNCKRGILDFLIRTDIEG